MSSTSVSTPSASTESKSARKKKAKTENPKPAAVETPQSPSADGGGVGAEAGTSGSEGNYESPYIKELYK